LVGDKILTLFEKEGKDAWMDQFEAITGLRAINKYHLMFFETLLGKIEDFII